MVRDAGGGKVLLSSVRCHPTPSGVGIVSVGKGHLDPCNRGYSIESFDLKDDGYPSWGTLELDRVEQGLDNQPTLTPLSK